MAFKRFRAKMGTHASNIFVAWHGQNLKAGKTIIAADSGDFDSTFPAFRKNPERGIWKKYIIEEVGRGIIFMSLA